MELIGREDAINAFRAENETPDGDIRIRWATTVINELPKIESNQGLSETDLFELECRFGEFVRRVVEDMISGEDKRWKW